MKENTNKIVKYVIKNFGLVLASSIPGLDLAIGTYQGIKSDLESDENLEKFENIEDKIEENKKEFESTFNEIEEKLAKFEIEEKIAEFEIEEKLAKFEFIFNKTKNQYQQTSEEYEITNIEGIEIFFADYVELNDYDFIENLKETLEEINEECISSGEYGCIFEEYVLGEKSLQIILEETYTREYVDEYIEKIREGIDDNWHNESAISKVRFY